MSVSVGAAVEGGATVLGRMGGTGGDYPPHLHVEIWTNNSRNDRIDPLPLIGQGYAPLATTNLGQGNATGSSDLMKIVVVNGVTFQVGARFLAKSAGPAYDATMQQLYGSAISLTLNQFNTILTNHGIPWTPPDSIRGGQIWFNDKISG